MYDLQTIKYMNSPEYQLQKYQEKKYNKPKNIVQTETEQLKIELQNMKVELEKTKSKLQNVKDKFKKSLIGRLENVEGKLNTLPIGTEISICDNDVNKPKITGTLTDESKKFYVINGKRYHKKGLEFFDVKNEIVILEDITW